MSRLYLASLAFIFFNAGFDQPAPRHLEEVTYDKKRNKLLLFGGAEVNGDVWKEPAMVYEWDGKNWMRKEAPGPAGRRGHGWLYDEDREETLLIGGVSEGRISKDSVLFDVWRWNGSNWKLMNTVCPVKEPEAVFDPVNKRILVYGDANNKAVLNYNLETSFELWEYKKDEWKKLSDEGPNINGSRMLSFDAERNRLVVPVYEQKQSVVWEWTGTKWEKIVCGNDYPSYRTRFATAYDPIEKQTILFGGLSEKREQLGDFWKWDGKQWRKIETKESPSVRNSSHFACGNNQLFLYGGSVPKPAPQEGIETCNELWSWKDNHWEKLN